MPSSLTFQLHITKTTVFSDHAIYYFHINIAIFHKVNFSTSLRKPSSIGRNKAQFQSKQHKFKEWIVQVLKSTFLGTLFFFNSPPTPQPHTHIFTHWWDTQFITGFLFVYSRNKIPAVSFFCCISDQVHWWI